jgi:small subunit ribosomal protein S16
MATKIRLTRLGKKKQPTYRVVVMDSRKPRDGKYIEQLGIYDPRQEPSLIKIDNERALHWLHTGAQPTERAQKLLEISGAWTQFKVAKGEIHTVGSDAPDETAKAVAVEEVIEEPAEAVVVAVAENAAEKTEEVAEEAAVNSSDES